MVAPGRSSSLRAAAHSGSHIAPQTVGAVVGIGTTPDPDFSFNAVTHGFYASRGDYTIMESGTPVYGPISYVAGQEFAVNVVGMTVQYLVDGAVVHTSGVPRNGVAFPTAVLYLAGDSVYNASITEGISSPASAFGESSCRCGNRRHAVNSTRSVHPQIRSP